MQSTIEQRVMASVGAIYLLRRVTGWRALKVYALLASSIALWQLVWVHKVFDNFFAVEKKGTGAIANYALEALMHTQVAVQLTLLVATITCVSLVLDTMRTQKTRPFA